MFSDIRWSNCGKELLVWLTWNWLFLWEITGRWSLGLKLIKDKWRIFNNEYWEHLSKGKFLDNINGLFFPCFTLLNSRNCWLFAYTFISIAILQWFDLSLIRRLAISPIDTFGIDDEQSEQFLRRVLICRARYWIKLDTFNWNGNFDISNDARERSQAGEPPPKKPKKNRIAKESLVRLWDKYEEKKIDREAFLKAAGLQYFQYLGIE